MILCSVGPGRGALEVPRLCSGLSQAGHRTEVFLEPKTRSFVGPAAFAEVAVVVGSPTETPEALVFAPASAATLAGLAHGLDGGPAGEAYSQGIRPAIVAPQLDLETASHPAVMANIEFLREDGCQVMDQRGTEMADAAELISQTLGSLPGALSGMRVLVSAGGTREPIDSVRFIGNRSSGKMGLAVAREAARAGAEVTVVAANLEHREPRVRWMPVETVDELREAIAGEVAGFDALVMAAAVSDFKPASRLENKMRRGESLSLDLVATEDILKAVRQENPDLFMVGFAATHGDPVPDARQKLSSKGVNLVVGNDISREGIGFGSDENEVYVVGPAGERFVPQASKQDVARVILDELVKEIKMEKTS